MGYHRGRLPESNQLDTLKYTIASYAAIDRWTDSYFFIKLDDGHLHRAEELESFIYKLFPKTNLHLWRNERQLQWKESLVPIIEGKDDIIWFSCNHDHVFIDYDLWGIDTIINAWNNSDAKYKSCYFSHWTEILRASQNPGICPNMQIHNGYVEFDWDKPDSVQIRNKEALKYMYFEHSYGDHYIPRPDWAPDHTKIPNSRCFVPTRELCRHFDGYSHTGIDGNIIPPLHIPNGFFEDNIEVSIDPNHPHTKYVDPNGVDFKGVFEDLPLFWKGRLSPNMKSNTTPDLINSRNNYYRQIAHCHHHRGYDNIPQALFPDDKLVNYYR
jgi:hypothetical protein